MEIWIAIICLVTAILLLFGSRKGTLIYELISLPYYWYRMIQVDTSSVEIKKIKFGSHRNQYLLLCTPKGRQISRSVSILYHHGGGWMFGRPESFLPNAKFFTDQGFAVVMPSYRKTPFYGYPAIREDLNLGLQKAIEILGQHRLPVDLLLSGMSAGGNLVSLIALDLVALKQLDIPPQGIKGLLLFASPTALEAMPFSMVLYTYAGHRSSDRFRQANPMHYLQSKLDFPVFFVQGKKDGMVPYEVFQVFGQALKKTGTLYNHFILNDGSHLDAGRWAYQEDEVALKIRAWLDQHEL